MLSYELPGDPEIQGGAAWQAHLLGNFSQMNAIPSVAAFAFDKLGRNCHEGPAPAGGVEEDEGSEELPPDAP